MEKGSPFIITGNWKMHKTVEESLAFIETLTPLIKGSQARVCLAVPFTALYPVCRKVRESHLSLTIGGQNMNDREEGAYTGEIAAKMLAEAGASFILLGHSERRQLFQETDAWINRKVRRALEEGLQPVLCVGETAWEREKKETHQVLQRQLMKCLKGISSEAIGGMVLAYEPVWAIGSGQVAHPEEAALEHRFCRELIAKEWGEEAAKRVAIQYGGSVKPENAADLLAQEDVDGLLVGSASLSPTTFSQIINATQGSAL